MTVSAELPTNAQMEQGEAEYLAWSRATKALLQAESAGRATILREVGSMLLQEAIVK